MTNASIIILTWQGMPYITACLDAVYAQTYARFDVIVVDNASTDGTADFVAAHYPQAQLIRNTRNAGFAAGSNVGIRVAQGDVIVLLNQDTVVEREWLAAIMQAMQQPGVGIVGCKCLYPDGRIQHAGGYLARPSAQPQHYGCGEVDHGQYDESRDVEFVTGAALAISRAALYTIGELDADLSPAYFEDTDWCFRARAAGYAVRYEPTARLTHHDGGSMKRESQIMAYHRGRVGFALKHWPREQLKQYTLLGFAQQLTNGSILYAIAVAHANLANISRLHRIRTCRNAIYGDNPSMCLSDSEWDEIAENLLTERDQALHWAYIHKVNIPPNSSQGELNAVEQFISLPYPLRYRNTLSYVLAEVANNYQHGGMKSVLRYGARFILNAGRRQ